MKQQNKPKVYLSYSLQDSSNQLQETKNILETKGFEVTYYKPNENYTEDKIRSADFVIFLSLNKPKMRGINSTINHFEIVAAKGQYSEAQLCYCMSKPAFLLHHNQIDLKGNFELLGSKLTDRFRGRRNEIINGNNWRSGYGIINSHTVGPLCNILDFMEGIGVIASKTIVKNNLNSKLLLLD